MHVVNDALPLYGLQVVVSVNVPAFMNVRNFRTDCSDTDLTEAFSSASSGQLHDLLAPKCFLCDILKEDEVQKKHFWGY